MTPPQIAALPMYDFPALTSAHDALWSAIATRLDQNGVGDVPRQLDRDRLYHHTWLHPGLLLGQACEYPLATTYKGVVDLIASPIYSARGCVDHRYRSAIIVRFDDHVRSLSDLRGRRCAINQWDSNSGMNLLRAAVAPLADGRPFFQDVLTSGSHPSSAAMVANGQVDVAAVDCITYAHLQRFDVELVGRLRILDWTPCSPCLPWVTAISTEPRVKAILRSVLLAIARDPALEALRRELFLVDFNCSPDASLSEVLDLQRNVDALDYPTLR